MNKILFLLVLSFLPGINIAQEDFKIRKVKIENPYLKDHYRELPVIITEESDKQVIAEKINSQILETLYLENNFLSASNFPWPTLYYDYEIRSNLLALEFEGEFFGGNYPIYPDISVLFDLQTGDELSTPEIAFEDIFIKDKYEEFVDRFCKHKLDQAFAEALECSDNFELNCTQYDLEFIIEKNMVKIHIREGCYPHVVAACSPEYEELFNPELLYPYLNTFGHKLIKYFRNRDYTIINKHLFLKTATQHY